MSESTQTEAASAPGDELARAERTYTYDGRRYLFDVQITGVVGAVAAVAGVVMIALNFLALIGAVAVVVGLYTAFNTYVAHCYPRTVTLGEQDLELESFGRRDVFPIADITRLQVRENTRVLAVYVRINGGGLLRGRYFVGCGDMTDERGEKARELFDFFLDTEARLDPDSLRVRARRQSPSSDAAATSPKGASRKKGRGRRRR